MKQVVQTLKTGVVEVVDVPVPTLHDSFVLVQTKKSLISAGTEKTKIDIGKKNLLQKAKARPDLVRQVLQKVKSVGLTKTIQMVKTRLGAPNPLGYSLAGEVIAVGGLVQGLKPGDRVACAGAGYANHAEFNSIPKNLVSQIPKGVSDEEAAFTTMGAIALQGIRLADPKLGETFLVLGLGLVGQLTVQMLKANGCNVIGYDLVRNKVDLAEEYGAIGVSGKTDLVQACRALTKERGVDGVIVCAGTSSNTPIEQCGVVTREKGRVVVVGAVRMDIPREDYFKKEISVVISRSYGPGRYDPFYEESGNDYPIGFVRFTEQRNMESFLDLLAQKKIDVTKLITHRFMIDEALEAYSVIEGKTKEPYLGIIMDYDANVSVETDHSVRRHFQNVENDALGLSLFGAGNYATGTLLPLLREIDLVDFVGIATATGKSAQNVGGKYNFRFCGGDIDSLLSPEANAVMVTTRHDTHASSVRRILEANKSVYVEKPLAMTVAELSGIHKSYQNSEGQLMVGYNRRYSPLTIYIQDHFKDVYGPKIVNIRVNAGFIPDTHWIQDPKKGGGRIIGEACHFIDLAMALVGAKPISVYSAATAKDNKSPLLNDNVIISVTFDNGSIASIVYTADGSKAMSKELVEVFGGGKSAVLNDFKDAICFSSATKRSQKKLRSQDKGQRNMLNSWVNGVLSGTPVLDYESIMFSSLATVLAVESLTVGMPLEIDMKLLEPAGEE
ncbi:bi-domain-containing oxidoreductase [Desulfovibrio sp. JC010]|uniref:bi-domain-containing oxidoreductase n=1 Tax=Desulfovibrio sp. JC010 TaxID=2593641 RepID=UPI0013D1243F|nr:bi-domain-containing oxidoreductase [Desulfovibrio sp. JC010]NDV25132.1 zinc-binding dehydrogenase [Desulfovibrio sp. JC010]